jgi:hypothetical protein
MADEMVGRSKNLRKKQEIYRQYYRENLPPQSALRAQRWEKMQVEPGTCFLVVETTWTHLNIGLRSLGARFDLGDLLLQCLICMCQFIERLQVHPELG